MIIPNALLSVLPSWHFTREMSKFSPVLAIMRIAVYNTQANISLDISLWIQLYVSVSSYFKDMNTHIYILYKEVN